MRRTVETLGMVLLVAVLAGPAAAQSTAPAGPVDSVGPTPDSAGGEVKKQGGGLLGKAKKLAGNKAVQQVAKTMACTMVPGGQMVAGAIDAASADDVGEAAAGAAGAVAGQPCMPTGMGAAGAAGVPGAGMAGLGGVGMPGAGLAGFSPDAGAGASAATPGALGYDEIAACLGLTPEEFRVLNDPTGGEQRQPTEQEMETQRRLTAKIDMAGYQSCMMQQRGGGMAPAGVGMSPAGGGLGPVSMEPADLPAGGAASEAPGQTIGLPSDPAAELKKGRAVVSSIDWLTGADRVTESSAPAFAAAMSTLAAALRAAGGTWRADIHVDKRYGGEAAQAIGAARLQAVVAALQSAGLEEGLVTPGKAKTDKRPRLEIVRVKR